MTEEVKQEEKVGIMRIYLKSGNVLTLPRVTEWSFTKLQLRRELEVKQDRQPGFELLAVPTVDLDQIEAITWEAPA